MHSKDASGPKEHAQPGIGPLARRVYELCPLQGIRDSREHNSCRKLWGVLPINSKDSTGPKEQA